MLIQVLTERFKSGAAKCRRAVNFQRFELRYKITFSDTFIFHSLILLFKKNIKNIISLVMKFLLVIILFIIFIISKKSN